MKRSLQLIFAVLIASGQILAQLSFTPMTAKEAYPDALAKAKTELASDVVLMNAIFVATNYSGVNLTMDLSNGKGTAWMYNLYSASRDSSIVYIALQVPLLGKQILGAPAGVGGNSTGLVLGAITDPWIDSPQALQGLKNGDAKTFFSSHPDAHVAMAIAMHNSVEVPTLPAGNYWFFMLASANDSLTCYVDGVTGAPASCTTLSKLEGIPEAQGYRLDQAYPNPVSVKASTGATIRYAVAEKQAVRLSLHDVLGREIALLQNGVVGAGEYTVPVSAQYFRSAGMYFYKLKTNRGTETRKLIVQE